MARIFVDQRRIEGDLVDAIHDLAGGGRCRLPFQRVDLDDQHILGAGGAKKRKDHRIAAIAAIPIRHAIDLHRAKQRRQASRRHNGICCDLLAAENAHAPGLDIGRRNENLQIGIGAQLLEIDKALDQILERIDVERIDVIGRKIARNRIDPGLYRRAFERRERQQPFHNRALRARQISRARCGPPEISKPFLRFFAAAAGQTIGQHDRVDRPCRGAGDALDDEPLVAQYLLEHTPGESAMRATALQCEIDALCLRRGIFVRRTPRKDGREEIFHAQGFMPKA